MSLPKVWSTIIWFYHLSKDTQQTACFNCLGHNNCIEGLDPHGKQSICCGSCVEHFQKDDRMRHHACQCAIPAARKQCTCLTFGIRVLLSSLCRAFRTCSMSCSHRCVVVPGLPQVSKTQDTCICQKQQVAHMIESVTMTLVKSETFIITA
jgi:hypothetical protein